MSGPQAPDPARIAAFRIRGFAGHQAEGEPVRDGSGGGAAWQDHTPLRVEAFDGAATLKFHALWERVNAEQPIRVVETVTGLETIVKFGNTLQLRHPFTVLIEAEFEAEAPSG